MDICIVNDGFHMGGAEKVAAELANAFQHAGEDVSIIDFSGKNEFYYEVDKEINVHHVVKPRKIQRKVIKRILYAKYKVTRHSLSIMDIYKEQATDLIDYLMTSSHDVVILCQGMLTALTPIIKRELPGLKVVAWQHNDFDIYTKKYFREFLDDYLAGIKEADLVVCLTASEAEKYKQLNPASSYIYNPLTIKDTKKSNLEAKNIVFAGRLLKEQKGLDYLIHIGRELEPGWKILVAGDGEDRHDFQQMISKHKLEDKIVLKGLMKSDELRDLYATGSVFVSVSRWEGFGLVITEAMASGLPVISFNNLGPREILNNGEFGVLIDDYNINAFIKELKTLTRDRKKREFYQQKSLKRAKDFEIDMVLKQWRSVLQEL